MRPTPAGLHHIICTSQSTIIDDHPALCVLRACSLMDLERYDVPPLQPGERRRLDPADEALLQVRLLWLCGFALVEPCAWLVVAHIGYDNVTAATMLAPAFSCQHALVPEVAAQVQPV
jgi:hypothetical protein